MKKNTVIIILLLALLLSSCGTDVKPQFFLNQGVDTIEIDGTWVDEGAYIEIDEQIINVISLESVDIEVLGMYEITYSYTDGEKIYSITRFVTVTDQTKPVITLNIGIDTIVLNSEWTNAGAIATDNSGETLTIDVTGEVQTDIVGTYEITYSATDSSGNIGEATRTVTVVD